MKKQAVIESVDNFDVRQAKYQPVADILKDHYGYRDWRLHQTPMDELVSCILSQNTSDINRDKGFDSLKATFPTWAEVHHAPTEELVEAIRSAGLSNQKGPRIQQALQRILEERGDYNIDFLDDLPIEEAKAWLTSLNGVGPKTAAIVLCFGFNRPAFPVDTHVHRVGKRIGFIPEKMSADKAHDLMEAIVPPEDYYPFHIQMIQHGRKICQARNPKCEQCPLTEHCDYYQNLSTSSNT